MSKVCKKISRPPFKQYFCKSSADASLAWYWQVKGEKNKYSEKLGLCRWKCKSKFGFLCYLSRRKLSLHDCWRVKNTHKKVLCLEIRNNSGSQELGNKKNLCKTMPNQSSYVSFVYTDTKLFFQVEDKNCSIRGRCPNFVTTAVPANLEDSSCSLVWVYLETVG